MTTTDSSQLDQLDQLFSSLRKNTSTSNDDKFIDYLTKQPNLNNELTISQENLELKEKFLLNSNILNWDLLDLTQCVPSLNFLDENNQIGKENTHDYKSLLKLPNILNRSSYHFKRSGLDGKITGYKESVNLMEITYANSSNSLSLNRSIDNNSNAISGSSSNLPFTPGGISMSILDSKTAGSNVSRATKLLHKDDQGLFDIPSGFERGILPMESLTSKSDSIIEDEVNQLNQIDNEIDVENEILMSQQLENDQVKINSKKNILGDDEFKINSNQSKDDIIELDNLLPIGIDFGRSIVSDSSSNDPLKKKNWAHIVDLNHSIDNFDELVPNPARTWPFELDTFQKEAVYHLEQGDSVFVAAHTSAGKTVVAEYAIAMSKRNMTKTIYTSPIKALSNQKFRDFKETFQDIDVGLITGDVQINPEANCLIMTTEILRSMLYRGADLIRDVEFVIFDEVHYVNDQDRGVVWEEVIIMLPQHVKFILLSATVPNTFEFATWIGRTKQKNIYVISTPKRPVPLVINLWAKKELIPVINEKREFLIKNFNNHKALLEDTPSKNNGTKNDNKNSTRGGSRGGSRSGSRGGSRGGSSRGNANRGGSRGAGAIGSNRSQFYKRGGSMPTKKTWPELINYLKSHDLLPAVIFVFSKKRCEDYADWLEGINFCTNKEKSQIHMFIEKSITRLRKEDRELPQILKIRSLLERGIAVHHGGLLPIVKELIEILFAKGLIRVLFATETFAMGLNLPTRTVVFSEIKKHDGNSQRYLTPGEFTQMAGRAGRRGKDSTGTVIVMTYTEPFKEGNFKEVTLGIPTKLESQFRLTYNMILNLLRIEALKVEEMIKYSFSENINQNLLPEHEKKIKQLNEEMLQIQTIPCETCDSDISTFIDLVDQFKKSTENMLEELAKTSNFFRIFRTGRLIVYRDKDDNCKLGFIFRSNMKENSFVVMTISEPMKLPDGSPNHLPYMGNMNAYNKRNFPTVTLCDYYFEDVSLLSVELISAYTLKLQFQDIMKGDEDILKSFKDELFIISRVANHLKETDTEKTSSLMVHQHLLERNNIREKIRNLKCTSCEKLSIHYVLHYKIFQIEREIKNLSHLMSDQNLSLLPDYESRLSVLKDAGFIDPNQNVLLKGRVACEISTGYELVLTELILDNFLGDFEPEEIVALLSVFIYEGRTKEDEPPVPTPRLAKGKKRIQEIYAQMQSIYEKYQVTQTQEEAEFLEKKRFALMNVVYEWARGLSFKEIMQISAEQEGTVVRVITRLDEVCRQVKTAAVIIGNSNLHTKMSQAQELIKRDIVFAASLYL
ncbi:hypothetical protein TBLA_0A06360 [Henningerozyma blattae CBS 6284]|uniref:Antiviral helicase SKI2 n=1 Tax=Henningerozyma blattae (strain ATCC 34711 / CBS 6284 / DSM 70876 / NBRC 10599 / NRRL Y-10934 / UCD 77-7) TaxID=1071380 RepID=I2GWC5_HENB6|nr:hypothetical protein TBLA_0A06360 [Tetrapisispora blattae CBS 6284]CCH58427.1 hypothetical protein TBLA_0A06360 [Tetrapisispora blattae CBS 6284]